MSADGQCDRRAHVSLHDEAFPEWPVVPRTRCAAGGLLGETFWYTLKMNVKTQQKARASTDRTAASSARPPAAKDDQDDRRGGRRA
jgi:hypothetical protein